MRRWLGLAHEGHSHLRSVQEPTCNGFVVEKIQAEALGIQMGMFGKVLMAHRIPGTLTLSHENQERLATDITKLQAIGDGRSRCWDLPKENAYVLVAVLNDMSGLIVKPFGKGIRP